MNGTIRKFGEDVKLKYVSSITVEGDMIRFHDAYGNSHDMALEDFVFFEFDEPEEVSIEKKENGHGTLPIYHEKSYVLLYSHGWLELRFMKDGKNDYHPIKPEDLFEITFEDEVD